MADPWRNRIVRHARVPLREIVPHPHNPRTHPEDQRQALDAAIRALGFTRSITVNERTGHVIDGHLRLQAALRDGQEEIEVEYVDLDEEEEALALATMDPMAAMAKVDPANLDLLIRDIDTSERALNEMIDAMARKAGLYADEAPVEESSSGEPQLRLLILQVVCRDEEEMAELQERLGEEGFTCYVMAA